MVRQTTILPKKTASDERDRLTLVSKYSPAGDQPTAISGLVEPGQVLAGNQRIHSPAVSESWREW